MNESTLQQQQRKDPQRSMVNYCIDKGYMRQAEGDVILSAWENVKRKLDENPQQTQKLIDDEYRVWYNSTHIIIYTPQNYSTYIMI
jgi:hypothetical protein